MSFVLKRRTVVRIISFGAAAIIALSGAFLKAEYRLMDTRRKLIYRYEAALEELNESIENIALNLEKAKYAVTPPGIEALSGEIAMEAGNAAAALSVLPIEQNKIASVTKFISQVGDYSLSVAKKSAKTGEISSDDINSLSELSITAADLSRRIDEIDTLYNSTAEWTKNINGAFSKITAETNLNTSLGEMEEALGEVPSLIYDGPFSDHITDRKSEMLAAYDEITLSKGLEKASNFAGVSTGLLKLESEEKGSLPAYRFAFENGFISVSKQGGEIVYFRKNRSVNSSVKNYSDALKMATDFLSDKHQKGFAPTYYYTEEGVCVINFAYKTGNTLCYPDLIKVGVALDNGEILFYEAAGFLMNHKERTLKKPAHTQDEAKKIISTNLRVNSVDTCIIPTAGKNEVFCYEFHCTGNDNEDILVYINADDLSEEQILVLLKTDGGTLAK